MELVSRILGSSYTQVLVTTAFSVYTSLHFANQKGITWTFKVIAVIFAILQACFIFLNNRNTRKRNQAEHLADASRNLQRLVNNRLKGLEHKRSKYLAEPDKGIDTDIEDEADFVCESIYQALSQQLNSEKIEVVLWEELCDETGEFIATPLSYGTRNDEPPEWFNTPQKFNKEKKYRIVDCFENNKRLYFLTKTECENNLVYESEEDKKNSKTHQYVAIPVCKRDGDTTMVLQIRAFENKILPKKIEEVDFVIDNWVSPFTNFFELALIEQDIIEEITVDASEN